MAIRTCRLLALMVLAVLVLAVLPGPAVQALVVVDSGFDPNANGAINAITVQSDGKILVGGSFTTIGGGTRNRIARLNADGSLDTTFDAIDANNTIYAITVQSDGKILVGGDFTTIGGGSRNRIARLNADGTLDTSFNPGTGANYAVKSLAVRSDGKILVGGYFTSFNSNTSQKLLVLLETNGTLDTNFTPNSYGGINVVKEQSDGKILVVGYFYWDGTNNFGIAGGVRNRIARLNADGTLDAGFDPSGQGMNSVVNALAVQSDGKILVGGSFTATADTSVTRNRIARLDGTTGALDTSFNPNSNSTVNTLAVQPDGKILVGGSFTTIGGGSRSRIARLNTDGSLDTGFDPGSNSTVNTLAVQPDGKILVGGSFTTIGGVTRNDIALLKEIMATPDQSLTEANLNGRTVTLAVYGDTFVSSLSTSGFTLNNAPAGTTVAAVYRTDATHVDVVLAYDGDFDSNVTNFNITVAGSQLTGTNPMTSENMTITAVVETAPTVTTTSPVTSITATGATAGGNVTSDGGGTASASITERGVVYSSTNSNPTTADSKVTSGTGTGSFTANLSGLTPGTTYYVRAFATNGAGTGYGSAVSFTTAAVSVSATPDQSLTEANLNGRTMTLTLTNDTFAASLATSGFSLNNAPAGTTVDSVYRTDATHADVVLAYDGSDFDNDVTNFSVTVAGDQLTGAFALASNTMTITAVVETAPTVTTTSPVTSITATGATAGGNVTSDGGGTASASITERGVVYSTSANPTVADTKVVVAGTTGAFTADLTGLTPGATYHIRAYATNSVGTSYGSDISFTTDTPTVSAAPDQGLTEANLNGRTVTLVVSDDTFAASLATSGFSLNNAPAGTTVDSVFRTDATHADVVLAYDGTDFDNDVTNFSVTVAGDQLTGGTALTSNTMTITAMVETAPTVTTVDPVTSITSTTATTGGNVTSDGGGTASASITERGVVYSTSANPTTLDGKVTVAGTTGSFIANLTGLTPHTTYHVRAYAINSVGTSYGSDVSFTTASSSPKQTQEEITVDVETGDVNEGSLVSQIPVTRTTEADGTKNDLVNLGSDKAQEAADKTVAAGQDTARIVIPDPKDEVAEQRVNLPQQSLQTIADGKINLEIFTENARIVIPNGSLSGLDGDLYFRVVPIRQAAQRQEVEQRARTDTVVIEALGNREVRVVERPATIETNMLSRAVTIILPLRESRVPEDAAARQRFLDSLRVFIEHTDGEKELVKGQAVNYKGTGTYGIRFGITKFSTFTIVSAPEDMHKRYIKGYPDGSFGPGRKITRAELTALLHRLIGGSAPAAAGFPDVAVGHWAHEDIIGLQGSGLMRGYPDGTFGPERSLTRAEMAAIVSRWAQVPVGMGTAAGVSDVRGHWAEGVIAGVIQAGYMQGYPDGTFAPEKRITRAEVVAVINRVLRRGPLYGLTAPLWPDVPLSYWAFRDIAEASMDHRYDLAADGRETLRP